MVRVYKTLQCDAIIQEEYALVNFYWIILPVSASILIIKLPGSNILKLLNIDAPNKH